MNPNNQMRRDYLKPCPYCGGAAKLAELPLAQTWCRVRCNDFFCGGTTWALDSIEAARAAWNRRSNAIE